MNTRKLLYRADIDASSMLSSACITITPATYAASTYATTPTVSTTTPVASHRPYPLSASAAHASISSAPGASADGGTPASGPRSTSRIPVTPAVLRAIFSSSRSPGEERSLSRIAFFRFSGFIVSCLAISLIANRGRGIRTGAALLGVGV
ncbi:hypothetical protein B0F90DRAFT_1807885 [Multifurca ochricompacta]|uniref:Uncharacterized protein n=1 Tax=Multifurca ochricompacta TaxID=376703 RepID=A0AAD4MBR3_9AGAM|nr:hypothetical protein B0F90DRAFT_1807885 [Multifurca ochricompacta]